MPLPGSITPTEPKVVPADEEKTFDKVRVRRLLLESFDPNRPARLRSGLIFYRETTQDDGEGGTIVVLEDDKNPVQLQVDDLYNTATFDAPGLNDVLQAVADATPVQALGIAVAAVQAAAEKFAKDQELI